MADRPPGLGLVRAEPVRLAVGHEARDRVADAERPEREARSRHRSAAGPPAPALVEPDDGGPERPPSSSVTTTVPRWVVRATPAIASRPDGPAGPEPAAGLADRAPVELGVLLRPAGLRRDVRLDRDLGAGDERAGGSNTSARTLCVPTSIARTRSGRSRGRSSSRTPGVHEPVRVERRGRRRPAPPCPAGPSRPRGRGRGPCRRRAGG